MNRTEEFWHAFVMQADRLGESFPAEMPPVSRDALVVHYGRGLDEVFGALGATARHLIALTTAGKVISDYVGAAVSAALK